MEMGVGAPYGRTEAGACGCSNDSGDAFAQSKHIGRSREQDVGRWGSSHQAQVLALSGSEQCGSLLSRSNGFPAKERRRLRPMITVLTTATSQFAGMLTF